MKTYLYNRISSGRQSSGDGLIRQSESAEVFDFIKNHKLEVVERMVYTGSSFTGRNFDNETVLGKFIEDVKTGAISVPVCLCFENWDRFGRDIEWKNTKRFLDLIYAGVSIGVVSMDIVIDQKVLSENSNILQLVVNDIQRARKESQRKSGFSKRNIFVKVNKAKNGEKIYFGGQSPRWIKGVKDGKFATDDYMIEDIKRIFDLYLSGKSCVGIAKILNVEKKTRFGLSKKIASEKKSKAYWYNTTIRNILTNKSLTGWCGINDFESGDYYPKIIDEQTFSRVQNKVDKNAINRGGSSSGNVTNLFKGLLWCSCCANDIGVRYHKVGNTYYSYMGCRKSQVKLCDDKTNWKTDRFEEQIFFMILQKSPAELLERPKTKTDSTLEKLNNELGRTNMLIHRTTDLMNDPELKEVMELKSNLIKLNQKRIQLKSQIQAEETKLAVINTNPKNLIRLKELFNMDLETEKVESDKIICQLRDNKVRAELKNIMPDLISRIDIDLGGLGFVVTMTNGIKKEMPYYT
jgi:DNA invertase Pin-like site-specific DNA recombinase